MESKTPIEQVALEIYPMWQIFTHFELGHGVGNGVDYNYPLRMAFLSAFEYLGLQDIPDPKKWVEELQAENTMLKNVLKGTDDSLTCISWEGDKPIRLVLEEEIEQLKAELKAANEFIEKGSK